jgi:protein gp37
MGENSKIEWTHHTFNPWIGCAKVSAGCKNCYAETLMDQRYGRVKWGVNGTRSRTGPDNWRKPLQWNKAAQAAGERHRVFCASLADVFEDRPELVQWRDELLRLIDVTPHLDWLLLTKRPENIGRMMVEVKNLRIRENIWLGTSVEDQATANQRIPHLLAAQHLARFTFLSMEPLLAPVDIGPFLTREHLFAALPGFKDPLGGIKWVIAGGESGHDARPVHPSWIRFIRDKCEAAKVPFLFKQWGEWAPIDQPHQQHSVKALADHERWMNLEGGHGFHGDHVWRMRKVGKHASGRLLDGVEHNGFPG